MVAGLSRAVAGVLFFMPVWVLGYDSSRNVKIYESYGDSITAGFLSDTTILKPPKLPDLVNYSTKLLLAHSMHQPELVEFMHARELTWPNFLAQQVSAEQPFLVRNLAVSGAKAVDLISQVRSGQTAHGAEAFIFMGHNDLCNRQDSVEQFADYYEDRVAVALSLWDEMHEASIMNFIPIADIHRVYEVLEKVGLDGSGNISGYSCLGAWRGWFPYCTSYTDMLKDRTLGEYMEPRLAEANRRLEQLAKTYYSPMRRNSARYLGDVHKQDYKIEYFAADCFHLSEAGQRAIAKSIVSSLE